MSELDDYDEDQEDQQPEAPTGKGMRQALEREKAEAATAKARAAAAEKELMFLKAKVDLESPIGKMFAKGYDGELDSAVIAAEYAKLVPGSTEPATPAPSPAAAQAIAAQTAAQRLSVGDTNPAPVNKSPKELAMEARTQTGSREEAIGAWLGAHYAPQQ